MASSARQQPPWQAPPPPAPGVQIPPLKIFNSLTRSKTPFVPIDPEGRKVTWYACGPTVYDDAHLGHARNYVSTDIIRRIMRDYFKFDLEFVMNITDVDDKIILRGRQQHLVSEFTSKHTQLDHEVLSTTRSAFTAYAKKNWPLLPDGLPPEDYQKEAESKYKRVLNGESLEGDGKPPGDKEAKLKMHLKTMASAAEALTEANMNAKSIDIVEFYTKTEDVLLPYFDSLQGSTINGQDHSIFTKLTQKFENRFMEDVRALNCADPDRVTRVTEYGHQIVDFVDQIIKNGFAYATSDGSVYFDITAFEKAGYNYARLEPWNRNDTDLQADGEGALAKKNNEKRSDADFALWKASKPGEPSWPSPWGPGRPGWHIECSAMASDVIGKTIDIHSGGIDLAFPHHDNELAQSEAYWAGQGQGSSRQWVNYFLHMGHLSIQGSKMSKSLKNFTTIREALGRGDWTPRGLRIVFLLTGWREGCEITDELVLAGLNWESKVNNFFLKAKDIERQQQLNGTNGTETNGTASESGADSELLAALSKAQSQADAALCDSFDTPAVMRVISELISDYNSADKAAITSETVLVLAQWITSMIQTFGLDAASVAGGIGWSGIDIPEQAKPFIYPLSRLRDEVRKRAIAGNVSSEELSKLFSQDAPEKIQHTDEIQYAEALSQFQEDVRNAASRNASSKDLLELCDKLRDVTLWDLGIYLEDRENAPAMVRPVDRALVEERTQKADQKAAKEKAKQAAKEERERVEKERMEKGKLSHLDMFRTQEYSAWDDEGLPIRDAKGEEIPKSRTKKLRKDWERQRKLHEAWSEGQAGS